MLQTDLASPNSRWKKIISDIRFWIVLLFIARLYGITNPPLEPLSAVRQCDVLMIARNFYELDARILYPHVDVDGKVLITGVEFPVYNYLIYLISTVFGFQNWYGRIINLIVSSIAVLCLYKTVKPYFGTHAAFNSAFILLFSGWLSFSRMTIPDIFGVSLCIISLYFSLKFFERGKAIDLFAFTVFAALGCLSKITAAHILTALLIPMLSRQFPFNRKVLVSLSSFVILGVVCAWYYYWVPYLNTLGYAYYFMGMPVKEAMQNLIDEPGKFLKKYYDDSLKYIGGALLLFSVAYMIKLKKFTPLFVFIVPFLAMFVFILRIGKPFYINGYYFVMIVPMLAFLAGVGLGLVRNRSLQVLILSAIAIENIGNQIHHFKTGEPYKSYASLESVFDNVGASRNDLIVIGNADGLPVPMYMTHRRGWNYHNSDLMDSSRVAALKEKGCKYILVLRKIYNEDLDLPYEIVFNSDDFTVYKL